MASQQYELSSIRMIIMDVDGVLTDGGMYYSESGDEFKKFNVKDGVGIRHMILSGLVAGIISSGIKSKVIRKRGELLGVKYIYSGMDPKMEVLTGWLKKEKLNWEQVAYIGDDVNDLPVIVKCAFSACPADAVAKVKSAVHLVL